MTYQEIQAELSARCGLGPFEATTLDLSDDWLFLARHRSLPRLLVTCEAREDLPHALPVALEEAAKLLAAEGGDFVIRCYPATDPRAEHELEVVRAPIR
jgi:hypothetical protein